MSSSAAIDRATGSAWRAPLAWLNAHSTTLMLAAACGATWFVYMLTAFSLDLPLMHFIAWRVSEGDTPYIDMWDMNGPVAYMLHWLMLQVPLPAQVTVALVMTGLTAVCVAAAAMIAGRGGRRWVGLAAGLAMAVSLAGRGSDMLAQRDMFIATFAAGALALMMLSDGKGWRWGVAGMLIGLAVGVKPTAAPFALIAVAGSVWVDLGEGRRFRRFAWLAAGGVAGAAVWVVYLLATGGLIGWWTTMVLSNVGHMEVARLSLGELLMEPTVMLASAGGAACIWAGLARKRAGAGREETAGYMMIGGFAIAAAMAYLLQGKGWPYQAAPATVMAVVSLFAAASGFGALSRERKRVLVALTVGAVICGAVGIRGQLDPIYAKIQVFRADIAEQMTASLKALPAGMKVQPLDTTDGALHAMTDARRAQASPVLYDFFMFARAPEDIAKSRAEVLAVAQRGDAAFLMTNQGWPDWDVGFARIAGFVELQALLDTRYEVVSTGHSGPYDYRLYAPRK